jgi:hypothetical protein
METYMGMRRRIILFVFLTAICLPLYAGVSGGKAMYVGGTVVDLKQETEGTFSAADVKELVFQYKKGKFTVPYDRVDSLEYGQKAGRRVGLAIGVTPIALLSKKRRHFLTLNYKDADDKEQAAVFELGKNIVRVTLSSLEARTGRKIEYQDEEARNSSKGN